MLVLALQFSKGIAGVGIEHHRNGVAHRTRRGSGAEARAGREGQDPYGPDSLKTEEKTKFIEPACQEERILRLTCHFDVPTNAPTGNWFEPDRTNAGQRLNSSSLERR